MFVRDLAYALMEAAGRFPALVLTGARQTGKTTLLKTTFPHATFLPLDLPTVSSEAEQNPEKFLEGIPEPILLDEIQYAPALMRYLKVAADSNRHRMGRYLMTGSQKFPLMRALSESMAGRVAILELDTLSASEIYPGRATRETYLDLIWRGGFPELHRDKEINARIFYASYVATYLERDVRTALQVSSLRDFDRFVRCCAIRSGQLLNVTDLARDIGIAQTTAQAWLDVLVASNQVQLLEPWFGNHGKRLIKAPKLYFRDTGLLCFLLGIDSRESLLRSSFLGAIWETFVLGQIMRAKYNRVSAANVYFWRDAHGLEVDFVLDHEGFLRLIEAKMTETAASDSMIRPIMKVAEVLGERAAAEHWVAGWPVGGTPVIHKNPGIRFVHGVEHEWLGRDMWRAPESPVLSREDRKRARDQRRAEEAAAAVAGKPSGSTGSTTSTLRGATKRTRSAKS